MPSQTADGTPISVSVENVGGIDETEVELAPGVSILTGRNATNRTSFLNAIMAALGSEDVALKGDADEGSVELTLGEERYTRTLTRRGDTTVFGGDPFLDDPELAELFAFLLESNPARRAVEQGVDLYDVIMRPVDTDEIDAEIAALEDERRELTAEIEEIEALEGELPELDANRARLEEELQAKRAELEGKRETLGALDESPTVDELEGPFERLREARVDLEDVRDRLADEERIVEALRADRADLEERLEGLAEVDAAETNELEDAIDRHHEEIQSIESTVSELQSVIEFNESRLGERDSELLGTPLEPDADRGSVTDQLVEDGEDVVCWTCGSRVDRSQVEETVGRLRELHAERIERRKTLREKVEELETQRTHIERTLEERRELEDELERVEDELDERVERLEALEAEAAELDAEVEGLEETVDELEAEGQDERLSLQRTVKELEFELDRLEAEHEEVEAEIAEIEARIDERDEVEAERDAVVEEIEALRSRIERLEHEAIERFNDEMDELVELLEFENVERVWIERIFSGEGNEQSNSGKFDIHVVRSTPGGSVYEDTVDHLSESEREVVGLVFALSGYLVHEVHEHVPFMLIDSLEAVDADRIATLIDHLAEHATNLVVALLPRDAEAVDDSYRRITAI